MKRFYRLEGAVEYVGESLEKAERWAEMTNDCHKKIEAIRMRREELMDILTELSWRRDDSSIVFVFDKKKICPPGAVPIETLVETVTYTGRIYVLEKEDITYVYIRF